MKVISNYVAAPGCNAMTVIRPPTILTSCQPMASAAGRRDLSDPDLLHRLTPAHVTGSLVMVPRPVCPPPLDGNIPR